MQSSFWKIASILGVICIGSLVVLEVQNRLPGSLSGFNPESPQTAESPDESAAEGTVSGDQAVDAILSDSQFDRMLEEDNSALAGDLDLSEPAVAAFSSPQPNSEQPNGSFYQADPSVVQTSAQTPAGRGNSAADSITAAGFNSQDAGDTANPFAAFEGLDAGSTHPGQNPDRGNAASGNSRIQPAGFQEEGFFADDVGGEAPSFDGSSSPFADTVPVPPEAASDRSNSDNSEPLLFIGQDQPEQPANPSGDADDAGADSLSVPFFGEDPQDSVPVPTDEPASTEDFFPLEVPGSGFPEEGGATGGTSTNTPPAQDNNDSDPVMDFFIENEEEVGVPANQPEPDSPSPAGGFFDADPAPGAVESPTGGQEDPFMGGGTELPFAEDIGNESPAAEPAVPMPELTDDPILSIPDSSGGQLRPTPSRTLEDQDFPDLPLGNGFDGSAETDAPLIDIRPADRAPSASTAAIAGEMRPHLTIRKQAPETATVGLPLDYSILVKNEGPSAAYDVVVEDEVTTAARFRSSQPNAEDFDQAAGKLVWRFTELAAGESREIKVSIVPTGEGMLDGVATVRFKAQVKSTTVVQAPALALTVAGPREVMIGEKIELKYVVRNEGTGAASNVLVRSLLPAGMRHPEGQDLEYEISLLPPGEQRELTLEVVAAEPNVQTVEAEVSAAGGASATATAPVNIVGRQLQIERRGPGRRFVGRPATYENVIINETAFDAVDAEVVEQVPQGMKFVSATEDGLFNPQDRSVTWKISRLSAGQQKLLRIELMPLDAGQKQSVVTVVENAGFRSQQTLTTAVEDLHNVSADISRLDGPIAVGETFGFSISIDNRGTADATDVELLVEVPQEIKVVGAGSRTIRASLEQGNIVRYSRIVRVEPGRQQSFELKLQGERPVRNAVVKAMVRYEQMQKPLVVSESVTVYSNEL